MTYKELVDKRKAYSLEETTGFINQSKIEDGKYDSGEYLDPWGQWQNAVPARVLVIGQDWGGQSYYLKNKGRDTETNYTCKNLKLLFLEAGIKTGTPSSPEPNSELHFANLIPFVRIGKMAGNDEKFINDDFVDKCINDFIIPLIDIVNPEIIISLGSFPYRGLLRAFNKSANSSVFATSVEDVPTELRPGLKLYPMFHCGAMGVNLNRKLEKQLADWKKLAFLNS